MKILLLNPNIASVGETHPLCVALNARGAAVLLPVNLDEAWKMIQVHGASLDLALIHREGVGKGLDDQGERLVALIKADPAQADLPIILSSAVWKDADFYRHQKSSGGVNAYLTWPFSEAKLFETMTSMFGADALPSADAAGDSASEPLQVAHELPAVSVDLPAARQLDQSHLDISRPITMTGLEMPPPSQAQSPKQELSGSLPAPSAGGGNVELELTNAGIPQPAINSPESMDLNALMNSELEPHERLELADRQGGGEATSLIDPSQIQSEGARQQQHQEDDEVGDEDFANELPYLFRHRKKKKVGGLADPNPDLVFAEPVGDAVIPGGAGLAPDIDTLKKYLYLREQDVTILSNQLKAAIEQIHALESDLKEEKGHSLELTHMVDEQNRRISEFEKEKSLALDGLQAEIDELRFQNKAKADKARQLESQVREATSEIQNLKERVRVDIRKIRVREKELENKLEIVKKDSEALISARETKIVELKRKIDLLEFNIDLLQDQLAREKDGTSQLRERLGKAAQVVRVAEGLLDSPAAGSAEKASDGEFTRAAESEAS